jgi:anti-sigma factor RsiW
MTVPSPHVLDALDELLDGRLAPEHRADVLAHLDACPECREAWDALRALRATLRALPPVSMPDGLDASIRESLQREPLPAPPGPRRPVARRVVALWAGLAAAALLLLGIYVTRAPALSLPEAMADAFVRDASGPPAVDHATADAADLQQFFDRHLSFPIHVIDLTMLGYSLAGGRVDRVAGRESSVFVYRAADGRTVLCHMVKGAATELPPAASRVARDGIEFFVYQFGQRTVVVWAEGDVLCALTSDLPPDAVLELAVAKAVKV